MAPPQPIVLCGIKIVANLQIITNQLNTHIRQYILPFYIIFAPTYFAQIKT